ncbi:L,D-transpeptidase family protein [Streptomyces apocyni]|uniref:L,D-transpeptidase family protein n=1 Tax=Streptomyces apocyni TaxID=2654677 RepID=UPI0012EA8A10|nr:L,D-transpeptidase family protein [Streptomyces apocyni]
MLGKRCTLAGATSGALLLLAACGQQGGQGSQGSQGNRGADSSTGSDKVTVESATPPDPSQSETTSASAEPSASVSASASTSASASPSDGAAASPSASASAQEGGASSAPGTEARTTTGPASTATTEPAEKPVQESTASGPNFPVPVNVSNATQVITVKSRGSYATVTAWAKGSEGWKSVISTTAGRVGSNGVTNGSTREQGTWTTPSGTYTITEGFGVEASGTSMPYTRVNDSHWWVQDPESKFYNQMHTEEGADFPLTESGERGSEHLVNYPTRYANALVIDFNRWPAVPGRGAGIFLHINGRGATAGCVSVPRATMDQIMRWIKPGAHPRIAIG